MNALMRQMKTIMNPSEIRLFRSLTSPAKIQTFLESLPTNYEPDGETNYGPRMVMKRRTAHCFEGAVFAAAVLAFHGGRPLLMDFATGYDDEDHCIALFKDGRYWGAISKTNHAVLRYRDAVYESPRELAMSYFHEYYLWDGRKSMRGFSRPFDLSKIPLAKWFADESPTALDFLNDRIAKTHYYAIPSRQIRTFRKATRVELDALKLLEWPKPDTRDNPED